MPRIYKILFIYDAQERRTFTPYINHLKRSFGVTESIELDSAGAQTNVVDYDIVLIQYERSRHGSRTAVGLNAARTFRAKGFDRPIFLLDLEGFSRRQDIPDTTISPIHLLNCPAKELSEKCRKALHLAS